MKSWCLLAVLLGPLTRTTSLSAQTADTTKRDTVTLPPIEVIGTILPIAGPNIASGIPARVATITRRQLDAWEPRTLAEALGTQPGVSLYDDLGSPYKITLSTRGFSVGPVVGLPPGVSVFLDGVRQNEPDAAQVNFDLLPLEHVRRIELLSGTASLLGPNSLGGAINLVTQRGTGPLAGELEVSAGSFDTYSAEGSVAGLGRGWDYYAAAGYERANGWRDVTGAESYNGFLNLGRLGPERGVRLQLFGATSYAETAGSLPESLFRTMPTSNFTAGDFEDLDLIQIGLSGYAPVGSGRGSFSFYHRRHNAERFNVNQVPDPNVRGFSRNRTVGANLDWRWTVREGRTPLSVRLGVDGSVNRVNIRLFEEAAGVALTTDVDSPGWDLAGYALADLRRGRVSVSGGFRYDHVRVPFEDNLDPTADTTSTFRRFSPRGGISVDIGPAASIYASLGGSFRAPAVVELACADETAACPLPFALGEDPPLDPVVATTFEAGARWTVGAALVNAVLYRTDVRDDISFIASDSALLEGFFANIGRTRREGLELAVQAELMGGHTVYANYAYTRATYRSPVAIFSVRSDSAYATSPLFGPNDVRVGSRLPLVPDHQLRGGASLRLPAGLEAGIDARYTGTQWLRGDEANATTPLDGYFTADLRLEWESRVWGVSALATNVFDSDAASFGTFNENRQTGVLERFLSPLEPRAFRVILRRSLGGS